MKPEQTFQIWHVWVVQARFGWYRQSVNNENEKISSISLNVLTKASFKVQQLDFVCWLNDMSMLAECMMSAYQMFL